MAKAKAKAQGRRQRRKTARAAAWWLRPTTLAFVAWVGTFATVTPQVIVAVTWLGDRYQTYKDDRLIAALAPKWMPLRRTSGARRTVRRGAS
jgi:hypothetical protein